MLPREVLMHVRRGRESKAVGGGGGLVLTSAPWDFGFGRGVWVGTPSSPLGLQPGPGLLETEFELSNFILNCMGL